jgi:hypothetical protein
MNNNLSSQDKEISEINKNRSETTWNWVNSLNTIMLLIIAVFAGITNHKLDILKQELEFAKFMESTIDNLSKDEKQREIALSVLYSLFIVEKQDELSSKKGFTIPFVLEKKEIEIPHRKFWIDISDTILRVNYNNLSSQSPESLATSKTIDILCFLKDDKCKGWRDKTFKLAEPNPAEIPKKGEKIELSPEQENKRTFVNAIFNESKEGQGKKGLVFIQYNNQSKEKDIDKFRKTLSKKWNAPGIEFIEEYKSPSGKYGDIRYFHTEEKALANELQVTLNQKYCPEKPEGCFVSHDLSGNYPNLPKKQFEIWIDVNKIPEPFH